MLNDPSIERLSFSDVEPEDLRTASQIYPLLQSLRSKMTKSEASTFLREAHAQGYVLTLAVGAGNQCFALAGHRTLTT